MYTTFGLQQISTNATCLLASGQPGTLDTLCAENTCLKTCNQLLDNTEGPYFKIWINCALIKGIWRGKVEISHSYLGDSRTFLLRLRCHVEKGRAEGVSGEKMQGRDFTALSRYYTSAPPQCAWSCMESVLPQNEVISSSLSGVIYGSAACDCSYIEQI